MLPNIAANLTVFATIDAGSVLLMICSLSFLDLGVMPPTSEWGMMLADAKEVMTIYPEQMLAPSAAIVVTVVLLHLIGDAAAASLDASDVERGGDAP